MQDPPGLHADPMGKIIKIKKLALKIFTMLKTKMLKSQKITY